MVRAPKLEFKETNLFIIEFEVEEQNRGMEIKTLYALFPSQT